MADVVCVHCGNQDVTLAQLRRRHPEAVSCCPERQMAPTDAARIRFLVARRDELQAAGNRLLTRARDAETRAAFALDAVRAVRAQLTEVGEIVRAELAAKQARIDALEAQIAQADRLGVAPGDVKVIAASCSTPASRAGVACAYLAGDAAMQEICKDQPQCNREAKP